MPDLQSELPRLDLDKQSFHSPYDTVIDTDFSDLYLGHQVVVETSKCQQTPIFLKGNFSPDDLFSFELENPGGGVPFVQTSNVTAEENSPTSCSVDLLDQIASSCSPVSWDQIEPTQFTSSTAHSVVVDLTPPKMACLPQYAQSDSSSCSQELAASGVDLFDLANDLFLADLPSSTVYCDLEVRTDYEQSDEENEEVSEESRYPLQKRLRLQASDSSSTGTTKVPYTNTLKTACLHNEDLENGKPGQRLHLCAEERQMLQKVLKHVPTHLPLTREEDRALRSIRRKIRNKLSAKASRNRRQDYISGLEERVNVCNKENRLLRRRVSNLESDNRGLLSHLRHLRSIVTKLVSRDDTSRCHLPLPVNCSAQKLCSKKSNMQSSGTTSLLVAVFMILAWTSLVPLPFTTFSTSLKPGGSVEQSAAPFPGRSRTLLSTLEEKGITLEAQPPELLDILKIGDLLPSSPVLQKRQSIQLESPPLDTDLDKLVAMSRDDADYLQVLRQNDSQSGGEVDLSPSEHGRPGHLSRVASVNVMS